MLFRPLLFKIQFKHFVFINFSLSAFYEHKEETPVQQQTVNVENFATKQELQNLRSQIEEVKGMISNGKQTISEQQPAEQQHHRTNARNEK